MQKILHPHAKKMNQTNIGRGAKIMPRFTHKKQQQKNWIYRCPTGIHNYIGDTSSYPYLWHQSIDSIRLWSHFRLFQNAVVLFHQWLCPVQRKHFPHKAISLVLSNKESESTNIAYPLFPCYLYVYLPKRHDGNHR